MKTFFFMLMILAAGVWAIYLYNKNAHNKKDSE